MNIESLEGVYGRLDQLNLANPLYKQWVFRYSFLELEKDLQPDGDITSEVLFDGSHYCEAKIFAKNSGILAGVQEVLYFLLEGDKAFRPRLFGDFSVNFFFQDGGHVKAGDLLAEIDGHTRDVLAVERVVLNLLMRMSGVATLTNSLAREAKRHQVLLLATRKTLWGLLDKRAVCLGGGASHRLNLSDGVMVKDSHLDAFGADLCEEHFHQLIAKFSANPRLWQNARFFEIEANSCERAIWAAKAFSNFKTDLPKIVLLDNFRANDVARILKILKSKNLSDGLIFEASGGINRGNFSEYLLTGIDAISLGCLTKLGHSLDMTMKFSGGRGGT